MREYSSYSVELKETPTGEQWAAYGWSVYPRGSCLEGQDMKVFLEYFDTEEEALCRYPRAYRGFRSANNYYNHLPGESDPVPGGMFPDDIDDGV